LFQCSNATGQFVIEELFNWSQEDLDPNDVFLLDTFNEVYVWVGDKSNAIEKKMSFDAALEYVANATDGRQKGTQMKVYLTYLFIKTPQSLRLLLGMSLQCLLAILLDGIWL
jgi:hypothetical protein